MTAEPTQLRVVRTSRSGPPSPLLAPAASAVRLAGSDRGAIVFRTSPDAPPSVASLNLSPEEEAACRSLARRLWQQTAGTGTVTSSLGGSTLLACVVPATSGNGALVVELRGRAGKVDAERLAATRDVAALLGAMVEGAAVAARAAAQAAEERHRAERALALNQALQALADTEDVQQACANMLAHLESLFPGVDLWSILLVDKDGGRVRVVADRGTPSTRGQVRELPLGEGYAFDAVVATGETRAAHFPRRGGRGPSARLARQLGIVSLLHVPLRNRNNVTGLLTLAAHQPRDFTAEERSFLETLGAQLGGQLDALRQLERAEAEKERLKTLIDTLPVGIAMFDARGMATLHNKAFADICGEEPDGVAASPAGACDLLNVDGRPLPVAELPLQRTLRVGDTEVGRELIVRQRLTGQEIPVLVNAAPIRDPIGRLTGVITVYQDIRRLREIDRLKDDFINTVSHELRTPTTTVRGGALTLLKRGHQLDKEVRQQLLQDMADEAERLYHLVEDLLGLSRVQAGMQLQAEPIIVHHFVNTVIMETGGRIGNHTLTVEVDPDLPLIEADPSCLGQVLRNLLENAVKFSPKGRRIEIMAALQGQDVVFSVLDRGSGIPAADMDRVFEPFYKTADAVRTGAQGAGLGLAVCRRLIEFQGGRIWAEARPGGGTAFRFTLPALQEETE